jgi:alpha-tubulin suppressor-like RCC1 family protein
MPTFFNYTENGVAYAFDDVFVPADAFRQGGLWGWGTNGAGQLGDNTVLGKVTPITTFSGGINWKQVSGGVSICAGIKVDGTLWVWGNNNYGQLGVNDTITRSTPVTTFAGGNNWKQVGCVGAYNIAAIKTDGTLWVWGSNVYSQLGINDTANRTTPVTTFSGGTNWKQVAGGGSNIVGMGNFAAIKTDGTLWVWGNNNNGQLGTNDLITKSTPVTTFAGGTNWKQVDCSFRYFHTAAVKTDGTLWVWGNGSLGELGNGGSSSSTPVTTFSGGNDWKQVACGQYHTSGVKTSGILYGWGRNSYGQLGNNSFTQIASPVTTFAGGTNWKQVTCGYRHTAAVKSDGTLWTWGSNGYGQLGINNNNDSLTPVTTFVGGTNWKQVSRGEGTGLDGNTYAIQYIDFYL